jgi:hypothetical protein
LKYKPLPIELELAALKPEEAAARRSLLTHELMTTRGFQLVTILLRDLEIRALSALRLGLSDVLVGRALGRIECIEEVRRSLSLLLPVADRDHVDWHDEADEGLVLEDPAAEAE